MNALDALRPLAVAATVVTAVGIPGCVPTRVKVLYAADRQANDWINPLNCGLGGEQIQYVEESGGIHLVNHCGTKVYCKEDDESQDGFTCLRQDLAPAKWKAAYAGTGAPIGTGATPASDGPPGAAAGTERGPCYGNGTCNAGLSCMSDLCVKGGSSSKPPPPAFDGNE
jgi:hypothetical protein